MFKNLQGVNVKSGFWKGHEGVVVGKAPFVPIYKVHVGYKTPTRISPSYEYLFSGLPDFHWIPGFQLKGKAMSDDDASTWFSVTDECIRYLYKHHHTALDKSDSRVNDLIGPRRTGDLIGNVSEEK